MSSLDHLGLAILVLPQLEQLLRILPPDLQPVRRVALHRVEPVARVRELLERVVDREEDPVAADLVAAEVERRGGEVARRGDPDVVVEVLADRALAVEAEELLAIFEPVA